MTDLLTRSAAREIGSLARDIERAGSCEEAPERYPGFISMSPGELKRYSLTTAIRKKCDALLHVAGGTGVGPAGAFDGIEAEADRTLGKLFGRPVNPGTILVPADYLARDLTAANFSGGGALVGTSTGQSFIAMLRNFALLFLLGAQRMPGLKENLTLPRQNGDVTLTWHATEATPSAESTPTYIQIAASPKSVSAYSEMSRVFMKQESPATELNIMRGTASALAVGVDDKGFNGTGASGEPLGILNTPGIGSASGTSLAYAGLVAPQTTVSNANSVLDFQALGYAANPTNADQLKNRQRFTGTDSPLWRGSISRGEIEGLPAFSSKQISVGTMVFGDFSSVIVAEWGVLAIEVNPFADFKAGIVGVRAIWSVDIIVVNPTAFVKITGIT